MSGQNSKFTPFYCVKIQNYPLLLGHYFVNVARFARNVCKMRLFVIFKHCEGLTSTLQIDGVGWGVGSGIGTENGFKIFEDLLRNMLTSQRLVSNSHAN